MAEQITIARPYARAAFAYAREQNALEAWRKFLARMAELSKLDPVRNLMTIPGVSPEQRTQVLLDLGRITPPKGVANLLCLMALNGRLGVLREVTEEFARLEDEAAATLDVTIITAVPLAQTIYAQLVESLSRRLGHKIEARFEQRPEIIGGLMVRIGDHVIDATLANRLRRLTRTMIA